MELKTHIANRVNMDGGSVDTYIKNSTNIIFDLVKNPDKELALMSIKTLKLGKFYLIKYNYNGNKIWCPIFTLEYKVNKNKNLLFAINIDYLPYKFRILFFNMLFKQFSFYIEENEKIQDVKNEKRFKEIKFEYVYKLLERAGEHQYCITAYDILKIDNLYAVSTNIAHRFIVINTSLVNLQNMYKMHDKMDNNNYKKEILNIMKEYQKLLEDYQQDSKEYYQRLRSFEDKLKIIKN